MKNSIENHSCLVDAEILSLSSVKRGILIHNEINKSKTKYRLHKPKKPVDQMAISRQIHNSTQYVAHNFISSGKPYLQYDPLLLHSYNVPQNEVEGILLGKDAYTDAERRLPTQFLFSDILQVGSSGSGKSLFNHILLFNAFCATDQLCVIYLDYKGEVNNSLSYMKDGKTPTFLKNKIIELSTYEKGMLLDLFQKDRIIIINLSYIKDDELRFRETILSILQDINIKLDEFKTQFTQKDSNQNIVKLAEFPFKPIICYEEAYKIFPNRSSHAYNHIKFINEEYDKKRHSLEERAKIFKRNKDPDSYEQTINELDHIPNVMYIHNKIMLIAQENANTMRYLGLGSIYLVQRFAELDTGLISQSSTWMVHSINSKQDENALKTSKLDQSMLRDYLHEIPEDQRIMHMLVSTPSFKSIVIKPKPALFHKAVSQKIERRVDLFDVNELS